MRLFPRWLFATAFVGLHPCGTLWAQDAMDSVLVEVYHIMANPVPGQPPITTYRIFIDLAPEHELQMVYGDARHQLRFRTTTSFENDTTAGGRYAHLVDGSRLNEPYVALDSWLSIGAASGTHLGVPLHLDPDGSVLECPPYPGRDLQTVASSLRSSITPLCIADGLIAVETVPTVIDFRFSTSYLGKIRGNDLETTDGAYAVLGGTRGVTAENVFLVAQLSTTGELSFRMNLQIETPDHKPVNYVARDPGPGEFQHDGLSYGAYRTSAQH
jgi:hypothetical protein